MGQCEPTYGPAYELGRDGALPDGGASGSDTGTYEVSRNGLQSADKSAAVTVTEVAASSVGHMVGADKLSTSQGEMTPQASSTGAPVAASPSPTTELSAPPFPVSAKPATARQIAQALSASFDSMAELGEVKLIAVAEQMVNDFQRRYKLPLTTEKIANLRQRFFEAYPGDQPTVEGVSDFDCWILIWKDSDRARWWRHKEPVVQRMAAAIVKEWPDLAESPEEVRERACDLVDRSFDDPEILPELKQFWLTENPDSLEDEPRPFQLTDYNFISDFIRAVNNGWWTLSGQATDGHSVSGQPVRGQATQVDASA